MDLIVVDERDRQPIGRPYLAAAIDAFTCCVVGRVVTLEAPSALSMCLCLAHAVSDKRPWLEDIGVDMDWPMCGKPRQLYLDNATEFRSEALRRGCEQHGIALDYRPPGQPHYGGIVERVIGTAMRMVHDELPGTTFSNPEQRGDTDPERTAVLTLRELERWLALAVGTNHCTVHGARQPVAATGHLLGRSRGSGWDAGGRHASDRVPDRLSAGDPANPDAHRPCHRPHPLPCRRAQALDRTAQPPVPISDPARPALVPPSVDTIGPADKLPPAKPFDQIEEW